MTSFAAPSAQLRANRFIIALLFIAISRCKASAIPYRLSHVPNPSPVSYKEREKTKSALFNGDGKMQPAYHSNLISPSTSTLTTKGRMIMETNQTNVNMETYERDEAAIGIRLVVLVAAIPYVLSVIAYLLLVGAAWYSSLILVTVSLMASLSTKVLALPVGLFLLSYGYFTADVEISLLGTSIFALLADSMGIGRLWVVLISSFKFGTMQRWYRHENGRAFILDATDPFKGHKIAAKKMVTLATGAAWDGAILGTDKVIIALLATKFVLLTEEELDWCGEGADECIRDLIRSKTRWVQAFDGDAGDWAREWTRHVDHGNAEAYENTLRFVIMLFCCVRRAFIIGEYERAREKKFLKSCLKQQRNGDMSWVYRVVGQLGNGKPEEKLR